MKHFKSLANVPPDQVKSIVAWAVECGSPGKVEELILLSEQGRRRLSEAAGAAWNEGLEALTAYAIRDGAIGAPDCPPDDDD